MRSFYMCVVTLAVFCSLATADRSTDRTESLRERAQPMVDRAILYLRTQQDPATGGWRVPEDGSNAPELPAITALAITGMLDEPGIDGDDPTVAAGIRYLLSHRKPDGGIYHSILPTYNTAISASAMVRAGYDRSGPELSAALAFLRGLQWSNEPGPRPGGAEATNRIDRSHAFYGGWGYGSKGRPDNSNTHIVLQALADMGVPGDDPAVQRAIFFMQRTQMHAGVNDMPYAEGSSQGGFIYSTSPDSGAVGVGESKAGMIEETLDDGTNVSRLRAYGSMTYAGFKAYTYAELDANDPRVTLARQWLADNYTLEENPGLGPEGTYYYLLVFARALEAAGIDTFEASPPGSDAVETRDWRMDLIERFEQLQTDDGSMRSVHPRWMEGDPVLITAYSLIAIQAALREN